MEQWTEIIISLNNYCFFMLKICDVIRHMPVNGFDVHLQAVAAGGPVAALLTHKQFLTTMFGCLVQT